MSKIIKLSKEEVLHIAKLANLQLTEKEVEKFQNELSNILGYIEILNKLDTKDIKPISQVTGLTNVLREDKVEKSLTQEEALSNTKNKEKGYFRVKAIFE